MGKKKLLHKLQDFFNADQREKEKRFKDIKKILKQLKDKERKIAQKLADCGDAEKAAELQQELDIIYAQRSKGVKIIKDMNNNP